MQTRPDGIPRRNDWELLCPTEKELREVTQSVESLGSHQLLTEAVILSEEARNKVADFIEFEGGAE